MLNRLTPVRSRWARSSLLAMAALVSTSCGGGTTDAIVDPSSISVSLGSSSGSITAGGSTTTIAVTVGRAGGFTGAIDLSVEGLPSGVTASASPATVAAGGTSSTVTLTATSAAVAGSATLTVRAKGSGVADKTASYALTVQGAAATGAFTLALSPTSLSLAAGTNNTSTITITRTGSFTGAVNLSVSGAPTGVTATLSSASVTGNSATLTVAVAASTAASTGTIVVTGSGTGVANATASLGVTTTVPATGSIAIALSPATLSVAAGASGTSTLTITRTAPFTGAVDLAVSGAPAGVTATLSASNVTGNTATLTIAAASGAAASSSTITVTASATGVTNATATLALTTTAGSAGSGSIAFRFCEAPYPTFFAVQDGTGAWTKVTPSNNTYSFDISSATGGVAWATPNSASSLQTNVYYGTKAEITAKGVQACQTPVTKTVSGSTAGLSGTDNAYVNLGGKVTTVVPAGSLNYTLNGVPDGARDLVATRNALSLNGLSVSSTLAKVIIRRGINPATGSTLPVLDFGGSEAVTPSTATATLVNLGADQSLITVLLTTANSTNAVLYADPGSAGASRPYFGVPAAQLIAGDLHYVQATALPSGFTTDPILAATSRSSGIFTSGAIGNLTLTFGPALSAPTVTTAATAPYVRLRTVLTRQAEYNQIFNINYQQSGSTSRAVSIDATAAYVGSGSLDITIPDLSAASYDSNFGLKTGVSTMYIVTVSGYSAGNGGVASSAAGVTALTAAKAGTITP